MKPKNRSRVKSTSRHLKSPWHYVMQGAVDRFNRRPPDSELAYRDIPDIKVLSVSKNGARIEIELRFRRGRKYCCCAYGCHHQTWEKGWWKCLRACLVKFTERAPPPMSVRFHGVIEAGALLDMFMPGDTVRKSKAQKHISRVEREKCAT